jgi:uncharacterized protein YjbJ (UPF0337 family)
MGLLDKILGRTKESAGDLTGNESLQREGAHQEAAGAADDHAAEHEAAAEDDHSESPPA